MSTNRRRRFAFLALGFAAAFAALTALYRTGATKAVDRAVQLWLRDAHAGWLDALAAADDVLFRAPPAVAIALLLAVTLWRFGPPWSWAAPLAISVSLFSDAILRNGWSRVMQPRALVSGLAAIFGGQYHASGSFPSGHVSRAVFLAVIALAFLPRKLSIPITLVALSTLIARMYTESHKLTDVLGGATLGAFVGCSAVWAVMQLAALDISFPKIRDSTRAVLTRRPPPDERVGQQR